MTSHSTKRSRRWPWIVIAVLLAVLLFVKDFAIELLAPSFQVYAANHPKRIWSTLIVGFIAALVMALWEFIKPGRTDEPPDPPPPANNNQSSNVQIGNATNSTIASGQSDVVAQHTQGDVVKGDKIVNNYQPAALVLKTLHRLNSPPRDFTGRTDELHDLLEHFGQGITILGLRGLGGVGKTALALVLAERLKPNYPDAQFYLDLQGASERPLSTEDALRHVIRAYHPQAQLPDSLSELAAMYRSVLHDQRALLLMDNAADRQQVEPLIPPQTCILLVTSRQQFSLPGMHARNLEQLPRADAIRLLLSIAERIGEAADEIAQLCGDLPLALCVAGAVLAEKRNLTPTDYAQRLREQRLKHLPEVAAALNVSYAMLTTAQQQQWSALGVFPTSFDEAAAAAVWQLSPDAARDALSDLMRWSLVEFEDDTRRYRLHDLARIFAAEYLNDNRVQQRFALHYCNVLASCNSLYFEGGAALLRGLKLFDQEATNIRAGQAWAAAQPESDLFAAELCLEYPKAGAYVLELRQHPRERIGWLEKQLAATRLLKCRKSEGEALGNLGIAMLQLCEPHRAIEYIEQTLVIAREMGDCQSEGNALGNLGIAWVELGEPYRAIVFYKQRLAIARKIGDRRGESKALGNLGNVWCMLGKRRKAIGVYEQQLTITREIGDRRGEGIVLWNMSLCLDKLGERTQAIARAEESLAIKEAMEDPSTEIVRQQLAQWRSEARP